MTRGSTPSASPRSSLVIPGTFPGDGAFDSGHAICPGSDAFSAAALICSSEICSSRRIGDERVVIARRIEGCAAAELSCSALQPESSNVSAMTLCDISSLFR